MSEEDFRTWFSQAKIDPDLFSYETADIAGLGPHLIIRPKRFLGTGVFGAAATVVREHNGEYISSGKDSHFRAPILEAPSQVEREAPTNLQLIHEAIDLFEKGLTKLREAGY